jgi:hypothetical protein
MKMQAKRDALEYVNSGIAEANKRAAGRFDGLFGSLPDGTSKVLDDIVAYLARYLLTERQCNETLIRKLLQAQARNPVAALGIKEMQDDGIRVAIGILASLSSALNIEDGKFNPKDKDGRPIYGKPLTKEEAVLWLLSGSVGLRDFRRQQGTHKERRPEITRWIRDQIKRQPDLNRERLWQSAPDWITDDIGQDRFFKRVSDQRKQLGIGRRRKATMGRK